MKKFLIACFCMFLCISFVNAKTPPIAKGDFATHEQLAELEKRVEKLETKVLDQATAVRMAVSLAEIKAARQQTGVCTLNSDGTYTCPGGTCTLNSDGTCNCPSGTCSFGGTCTSGQCGMQGCSSGMQSFSSGGCSSGHCGSAGGCSGGQCGGFFHRRHR